MLTKKELDELKKTYRLKAYYIEVNDSWEVEGEIVFAKSEKKAKQQAWRISVGDWDVEHIDKVERKPEFDKFANLGYVPLKEQFEAGWRGIECDWCGREISNFAIENYEDELAEYLTLSDKEKTDWEGNYYYLDSEPYNPQFEGKDLGFCCLDCQTKWHKSRNSLNKLKLNIQDMLKTKYPDCTIKYAKGNFRSQTVSFDLTVPELQYKVTYESEYPDTMLVNKCDIDAWNIYKNRLKTKEEA
jgi:hypothetical protein